jgi:hypothetical protein
MEALSQLNSTQKSTKTMQNVSGLKLGQGEKKSEVTTPTGESQ